MSDNVNSVDTFDNTVSDTCKCTYCGMFDHSIDDCAMLTCDYVDALGDQYLHTFGNNSDIYDSSICNDYNNVCDYYDDYYEDQLENEVGNIDEFDDDSIEDADEFDVNKEIKWVHNSSIAAFDYYQKTGIKLKNSDFAGRNAGSHLKADLCNDEFE